LLALAAKHRIPVEGPRHVVMLLAGFSGLGQPRRVFSALVELGRGKIEMLRGDKLTGEGVIVWTDAEPRRLDPSAPFWPRPIQSLGPGMAAATDDGSRFRRRAGTPRRLEADAAGAR
jgi:hypothetical protein